MDLQAMRDLVRMCHDQAVNNGWWDTPRNDGELIALMHSELSEALEALRHPDRMDEHCPSMNPVGVELADVVIRIADYCGARNIDLADCIQSKYYVNGSRGHRHGGKKF